MAVEIGALRAMLSLDSAAFEKGAKRAQASMSRLQRSMAKTSERMGKIGRQMTTRVTAPLAAAAGLMARSAVTAAFEIERLAQVSDAGTTEFQRFAAGAREVGVQQDKLADILKDTQDRVGDFIATGGGPMADFFENIAPKVGVTAEQFAKLSGPEALQLYVSSLEKAGLSQQQMTFYMEALASDATLLLPLLRDNGAEMQRLGDRAQRLGEIMDAGTIASLNDARETMRDMRAAGVGLRNEIVVALAPSMERIAEVLRGLVEQFRALSPRTRQIAVAIAGLAAAAGPAAIALGAVAAAVSVIGAPLAAMAALATAGAGALVLLSGDAGKYEEAADAAKEAQKALNAAMGTFYDEAAPSSAREAINAANANYQLAESALAAAEAEVAKRRALLDEARGRTKKGARDNLNAALEDLEAAEAALDSAKRARDRAARSVTSAMDLGVIDVEGGSARDLKVEVEGLNDALKGIGGGVGGGGSADAVKDALGGVGDAMRGVGRVTRDVGEELAQTFSGIIRGATSAREAMVRFLDQVADRLLTAGFQGAFDAISGALFNSAPATSLRPVARPPSFAGGGYTGDGARTGGLDGRGGFPAILHPNESVIDHTKGGLSVPVHIHNYAGAEVRAERRQGRIDVVVREAVNEVIGSGGADRAMKGRFGVRPRAQGG